MRRAGEAAAGCSLPGNKPADAKAPRRRGLRLRGEDPRAQAAEGGRRDPDRGPVAPLSARGTEAASCEALARDRHPASLPRASRPRFPTEASRRRNASRPPPLGPSLQAQPPGLCGPSREHSAPCWRRPAAAIARFGSPVWGPPVPVKTSAPSSLLPSEGATGRQGEDQTSARKACFGVW